QMAVNHLVRGSSPRWGAKSKQGVAEICRGSLFLFIEVFATIEIFSPQKKQGFLPMVSVLHWMIRFHFMPCQMILILSPGDRQCEMGVKVTVGLGGRFGHNRGQNRNAINRQRRSNEIFCISPLEIPSCFTVFWRRGPDRSVGFCKKLYLSMSPLFRSGDSRNGVASSFFMMSGYW
ncbi:MAG: hypothetical protein WCK00_15705, partial [Deltaproteobacteria bacterium]